jgi:hypothetical protein
MSISTRAISFSGRTRARPPSIGSPPGFAGLESARYGGSGFTRILAAVSCIERQLGSGDLGAFTSPEINRPVAALPAWFDRS